MLTDAFRLNVKFRVGGKEVTDSSSFYNDYQAALKDATSIIESESNIQKNDVCHVWIDFVKVERNDNRDITNIIKYATLYDKFVYNDRPIKRYYLTDKWLLCYKKYGKRLIEGVVTERLSFNRYVFKAFTHRTGTATFRKPEIVNEDKIVWQRVGE